jgi:ApaLI-like restriction endonuclease
MTDTQAILKATISELAKTYTSKLKIVSDARIIEMENDDNSHFLLYRVLGIGLKEGRHIDQYQNKGRFLYKYAGSFLEEATMACFERAFPKTQRKLKINNSLGSKPKTFEIDCLVNKDAYEIKWRDATTDGDHIIKEHARVLAIKNAGYRPVRIMFYYPNRVQAQKIQATLKTIYEGLGGQYFFGNEAWLEIKKKTNVDLHKILFEIAESMDGAEKL